MSTRSSWNGFQCRRLLGYGWKNSDQSMEFQRYVRLALQYFVCLNETQVEIGLSYSASQLDEVVTWTAHSRIWNTIKWNRVVQWAIETFMYLRWAVTSMQAQSSLSGVPNICAFQVGRHGLVVNALAWQSGGLLFESRTRQHLFLTNRHFNLWTCKVKKTIDYAGPKMTGRVRE